jgi:hypothetical protein
MAELTSSAFWVITRQKMVHTDVSGLPIGPIFRGQAVFLDSFTLEDGAYRSVSNQNSMEETTWKIKRRLRNTQKDIK